MSTGPNRSRILAVAFDLDGLMFDTEALFFRVAAEMVAARGRTFHAGIMRAMIGRQPSESGLALKTLAGLDEDAESLMAEATERFLALVDTEVRPTPGLLDLLDRLDRRAMPLAVATSSHRRYAERLLGRHKLIERFALILAREDVARHKPDPEIYATVAARFGIEPGGLLVLEDTPTGLTAAKAAGAFAVGVPHEHSPAVDLPMADLLVPRLDDPALLARIGLAEAP